MPRKEEPRSISGAIEPNACVSDRRQRETDSGIKTSVEAASCSERLRERQEAAGNGLKELKTSVEAASCSLDAMVRLRRTPA
jgi:hypothetical protein